MRIVLMPDAWGATLVQHRELLLAWREDVVQLAVNRELLLRYMRLMHRIGLSESLMRRWGWWFNSRNKCILARENPTPMTAEQLCDFVAHEAKAGIMVYRTCAPLTIQNGSTIRRVSLQDCAALIQFPKVIKHAE